MTMVRMRGDRKMQESRILRLCCFIILTLAPFLAAASGEWEIVRDSNLKINLKYIKFFDENVGFAYGLGSPPGLMLMTNNGGQTWSREKVSPNAGGGMFISPDVGIFITGGGRVYKTQDGGGNWESFPSELGGGFRFDVTDGDLHFISPEEGWATGRKDFVGCIFHTDDGGRTWEKQFDGSRLSDSVKIHDLFFLDSKTGWGVGRFTKDNALWNLVVVTRDGGKSWFHRTLGKISSALALHKVLFSDSRTGWTMGAYSHDSIFHTEDGGLTWEVQFEGPGRGICFLDEKKGWILQPTSLLCTVDGGKTWSEKQLNLPGNYPLEDMCFINEKEGWVAGQYGLIVHTRDGGETWERQAEIGYPDLWSVDFISPGRGIAVGREVLITEDGLNWRNADWMDEFGHGGYLTAVDFVDERTGWVTDGPVFWKTEDAGETWKASQVGIGFPKSICFVDQKRGWAADDFNGNIYFTTDGGEKWDMSCSGGVFRGKFTSVYFIDEKNGWATKLSGDVYRAKDGGDEWLSVGALPGPAPVGGICFANEDMGWAIVDIDKIYHTEDGGKRWRLDAQFTNAFLRDICYDGGEHLYVVGIWGMILRYADPDLKREQHSVEAEGKAATQWGMQKTGENGLPERTEVYQNYPNPFNPDTWIPYQLSEDAHVVIKIYAATGQLVRTLGLGYKPVGFYVDKAKAACWDGKNETGEQAASDVYFYTIQAGDFSATKKMIMGK
jgi:photosystem II stability/assembly factor-like uncharacterized protein